MPSRPTRSATILLGALLMALPLASAQIPHNQDRPPNEARSPDDAARAMTVPPGFTVEVVASEPDLVNPVAMSFDERGRVWVTESLEYPRRSPGRGRDRVRILEDTDGDGVMDKFTTFADGLNIPSGIAVGAGGVWVANAPEILFLQDTDGDGKADKREVVVTGFGRDDTHELPNSLTWGPDGYLYGLNGVFNRSVVKQDGETFEFTCALFRIHPRTRKFELFAEGTSNPWGVAWDQEGSAFVSACVIDHLWHLAESGYYHRQGGPYPPFTWKIESIVDYKHQKAAYCGIQFFDSDAYPPEYRGKLYMGNIHGGCINVDGLARNGSTYKGIEQPDFLTANDAWFMPVSQKVGPDGCLYILDWYDRYHCYQDANRDPMGIDRLKGRLYRVRYKDSPRAPRFDLAKETDDQLVDRLRSPNIFFRDVAQRLLRERNHPSTITKLQALVLDESQPRPARMHALWTVIGADRLGAKFHLALLSHNDPTFRAWGVRAAGNAGDARPAVLDRIRELSLDPSLDVMLQVAVASKKIPALRRIPILLDVLSACGGDPLIPHIVWQNLHPMFDNSKVAGDVLLLLLARPAEAQENMTRLVPRIVDRLLRSNPPRYDLAATCIAYLLDSADKNPVAAEALRRSLTALVEELETREVRRGAKAQLHARLQPWVRSVLAGPADGPFYVDAVVLASAFEDRAALKIARDAFSSDIPEARRLSLLGALVASGDESILDPVEAILVEPGRTSADFRGQALGMLVELDSPRVADVVLRNYAAMEPELRPKALELLTQRPAWSLRLLKAIAAKTISKDAVNLTQVRKLLASKNPEVVRSVREIWGTIRQGRNPERERVIEGLRQTLGSARGNARAGAVVFKNVCAQCHKIYGEGQDVGPDLTSNGRASFDQLLSNLLDPSLVIGESYQATLVATTDGRVLTGLRVEDTPERVTLKIQGGKVEIVPRDRVDEVKVSPLSLMPEDLEKQLKPQELVDLLAFLALDKPPADPSARPIPGTPGNLVTGR